jgi:uncharacterized protein YbjQ (UPF0145 family)
MTRPSPKRPSPALSDLSVTEFLTLARAGFLPQGLVIGASVYDAGMTSVMGQGYNTAYMPPQFTMEIPAVGNAMRAARRLAIQRMQEQASQLGAEGVVGVRLQVEHHVWHGGHTVARFVALGTAISFDPAHAPKDWADAPSLHLRRRPFTSDLSGQDFVTLMLAGYRPVSVALGNCVYQVSTLQLGRTALWRLGNQEIADYTQAFMNARETAMQNLSKDLFDEFPNTADPDRPIGVVGMSVDELIHKGKDNLVEYSAVGTAVARLADNDPRRAKQLPAPTVVMPVDS